MGGRERVGWDDPRNAGVLAYLAWLERLPAYVASAAPASVDSYQLGAHPDWVEVLWQWLDAKLPTRCAWVVHGRAALVRRSSGIVFGLALGTLGVALRVPSARHAELGIGPDQRSHRHQNGQVFSLDTLGPECALAPFGAAGEKLALAAFEGAS